MMSGSSEILLEFTVVGRILRVAAVDAASGREVVIQGPASTPRAELARLAARKLRYVLDKERSGCPARGLKIRRPGCARSP